MKKLFLIVFITTLLYRCGKPCFETRGIEGAGLAITFFHAANNEYFYPRNTNLSIFKIDSLQVKDSRGNQLRTPYSLAQDSIDPLRQFYRVSIYPIFITQEDQAAFDSEQTKYIYIKYNYNTFDTLKLVFKTRKEKCINNYEYVKAYYKNTLLAESYNKPQGLLFKLNH